MLRWMVSRERRSWEEDEEEVDVDVGEGGNESLRRLSEMGLTWQPKGYQIGDKKQAYPREFD